jgi:capsular exopolysaccharide synthesis family protein
VKIASYTELDGRGKGLEGRVRKIDDRLVELRIMLKGDAPLLLRRNAYTPDEPSMPKWSINVPAGVLLGLVIGFGLAFLLEFVDTSIKGPGDVARRVDLPLLGMVPHHNDLEEEIDDLRLAFASHPNSLMSEAFRQVRTCLLFSGPASQRRTLLVTSPLPEDGRTTVAMNLAASVARGGRKVLVIDSNFRQPAILKLFRQCPEAGLSSALVGQAEWRELVMEVEPNLSIMASGPLPPNPAELLGSEQMTNIMADMLGEYDQIIFDGAPCLLMTDAPALSTLVDGVIMVVRAGANTYGIVQRAREMLNRIGAHVVGVVLNGVRTVAGGYLRKNYEAFYEYQERARLPGQ